MSRQDGLSEWMAELSNRMPHLTKFQATVLAMWSYGIVMTGSCGRRTVATFLALFLGQKVGTVEQRLREWCYNPEDKRGEKRCALEVTMCFVPLLCWIISLWTGAAIALAVNATSLGDRFVVLTISVVAGNGSRHFFIISSPYPMPLLKDLPTKGLTAGA